MACIGSTRRVGSKTARVHLQKSRSFKSLMLITRLYLNAVFQLHPVAQKEEQGKPFK